MGFVQYFLNSKVTRWISNHLYLTLLIPLSIYSIPLLHDGISIAGDFPYLDTSHYAADKLWMWVDKGSRDGFEFVARYSIIGLWYGLNLINFNSDLATKVMIVSGFLLSSFCFYFSFLKFFRYRIPITDFRLKLSGLIGSLFYAYNVWSFNRIHHWYLWIGYSILPLFLVAIFYSFKTPKNLKYIFLSTFIWSFASITPHMVIFYGIIFACTFIAFVINGLYKRQKQVTKLLIPLLLIICFYSLVNMYWIYPYTLSSQIRVPNPPYELTRESLELLSRESNFVNSFRIMAYWLDSGIEFSNLPLFNSFWIVSTFTVPLIAFSSLLLKKSIKFSIAFAGSALTAIFLSMGTNAPLDYYSIALNIPIISKFVWVFRDPEKWAFIAVFAYSFLIGFVCYKLLRKIPKEEHDNKKLVVSGIFVVLLLVSIFVSSYPYYKARMDPLKPIVLPSDFDGLNNYLAKLKTDKVYFIPYPIKETKWDKGGYVQNIYQMNSIKPNIDSSEYYPLASTYYKYLVDVIMQNRSNSIRNIVNPLGTSYVIFHNDSWNALRETDDKDSLQLLNKMYHLNDIKNITDIGLFTIFKTSNNEIDTLPRQVNIPNRNIGVIGGLEILSSMSAIPSFNPVQSSLLFLDDIHPVDRSLFNNGFSELLVDRSLSDDEFALSNVDNKYILAPFDYTLNNDPTKVWSKSGTRDPIHGAFHPDLNSLGIENWDFDYGKGIVKTKAITNISMPIDLKNIGQYGNDKENNFFLFMRYFMNQKGGPMNIYVDNKFVTQINAFDKISNDFVWEKLGNMQLTNQRHTITLQNVGGFNAVNIFALIPVPEMDKLMKETSVLLKEKPRIIYLLEAETNFNNIKGKAGGPLVYLSNQKNDNASSFSKKITGHFTVPKYSDLVSLQFQSNKSKLAGLFSVNDVQISPTPKNYDTFSSDFERGGRSVSLGSLRHTDWLNLDKDFISTLTVPSNTSRDTNSLKVNLKAASENGWDTISSAFVPISDEGYYNASLELTSKDVLQLHSKILFFDAKQREIPDSQHYILDGKDGTFSDTFDSFVIPPKGAEYIKFQVLSKTSNPMPSSYILDNVKFEEITFPGVLKNTMGDILDKNINNDTYTLHNNASLEGTTKVNYSYNLTRTIPYQVKGNHTYDYTIDVSGKDVDSYSIIAAFGNSGDVSENATRYGGNASNGRVLSLDGKSEIHTKLNIINTNNYTIGIRAKTCETCTFLNMNVEPTMNGDTTENHFPIGNFSLRNNMTALKWVYSNNVFGLTKGLYDLKIYSDSPTDIDAVAIYPVEKINPNLKFDNVHEFHTIEDAFSLKANSSPNSSPPAQIVKYEKINPTKYTVKIHNAVRPFMLSFAESYDPLWAAHIDTVYGSTSTNSANNSLSHQLKASSIPLYGLTNGFYINKTGDYRVVIEYEPQKWFMQGTIISAVSIMILLISILVIVKQKIIKFAYQQTLTRVKKRVR